MPKIENSSPTSMPPDRGGRRKRVRRRFPIGGLHPVDVHVGGRVRLRRTLLGISQQRLGAAVGLTFQQIQKYERGANRIGASRLYEFSGILEVPVSFFFEGMPGDAAGEPAPGFAGVSDQTQLALSADPLSRRETDALIKAYYEITDENVRRRIQDLARSLGGPDEG